MKEEKEAFIESLYLQYAGKLERASLNYVRHRGEYRDLVDDSIQKTFLKAYEEYDTLKDAPYIEAWLFKVCRYRLMTAIDALPDRISSRETLERVLDTLNEREKGLVQAHFVDGVSCEELAKRQNTTIGAIRTALARLRKKARRLAEDERT